MALLQVRLNVIPAAQSIGKATGLDLIDYMLEARCVAMWSTADIMI